MAGAQIARAASLHTNPGGCGYYPVQLHPGLRERVPDMLEAAQAVANNAQLRPQLIPVLKVAEEFFLQPMEVISDTHRGLLLLLDEAYLAHRLVEEVNDRYVAHGGESLIPMNNTRANLIVH